MPKEAPARKSRYVAALIVALCGVAVQRAQQGLTVQQVDRRMSELSNWGRWGKDHQRGTLNLLAPDVRREALKLAREGIPVSPVLGGTGFPLNPIATF